MKIFLALVVLFLISCNPKQNKEIVKEEVVEVKPFVDLTPKKVIFCKKIFEREEKLSFINNVFMAFVNKDSSLIAPYINTAVSVDIENTTLSGFSAKSISESSLSDWTNFVTGIAPSYGVSVCNKLDNATADFVVNSCWKDLKPKPNTAYIKYIHFKKINGQYLLKGIGFYRG